MLTSSSSTQPRQFLPEPLLLDSSCLRPPLASPSTPLGSPLSPLSLPSALPPFRTASAKNSLAGVRTAAAVFSSNLASPVSLRHQFVVSPLPFTPAYPLMPSSVFPPQWNDEDELDLELTDAATPPSVARRHSRMPPGSPTSPSSPSCLAARRSLLAGAQGPRKRRRRPPPEPPPPRPILRRPQRRRYKNPRT